MKDLHKYISYKAFLDSPHPSSKHSTYFPAYDDIFTKYIGKEITFVEVGVFGGGSLFMWRNFFGKKARIIGIELNPEAKKWEKDGFEIFIGDQSDPDFWRDFYKQVGEIDILLDDGGHTYVQQIVTAEYALDNIKDGGVLVVEDTHTSYMDKFGVIPEAKGEGLGAGIWHEMRKVYPQVFWRSRPNNPINNFYTSICEGCQKQDEWHIFWIGISDYGALKDCIEYAINKPKSVI